jgi:DNA-nicking Smr family endonuclease
MANEDPQQRDRARTPRRKPAATVATPAAAAPPASAATGTSDAAIFREAMRDVRPLEASVDARIDPDRPKRPRARPRHERAARELPPPPIVDAANPPERLAFRRAGVRDGEMRRLRRATAAIEDEIDLHGLTQAHAYRLLCDFLEDSRARGLRRVRVIHGKGLRSGARGAVLKAAVDAWLRERSDVLAFSSARPVDGGGGALYVLLRA